MGIFSRKILRLLMNGNMINNMASLLLVLKEKLGQDWTFDELKHNRLEHGKKMGDKPGTIWDMFRDMKAAGFGYVDCVWKFRNLAIMAASKI